MTKTSEPYINQRAVKNNADRLFFFWNLFVYGSVQILAVELSLIVFDSSEKDPGKFCSPRRLPDCPAHLDFLPVFPFLNTFQ